MNAEKSISIMQPYFLPYYGYFQLISAADKFVIYDNIEFTKKGWITRNRFLQNGVDKLFSLELEKASDFLDINQRLLSDKFNREKLLAKFYGCYIGAPNFKQGLTLLEQIICNSERNLFMYLKNSITIICNYFEIETEIINSSLIQQDKSLKGQNRVIDLCQRLGGDVYINPRGGKNLYDKAQFAANGLNLQFLEPHDLIYSHFNEQFVPSLSIIDPIMFMPKQEIIKFLSTNYELV